MSRLWPDDFVVGLAVGLYGNVEDGKDQYGGKSTPGNNGVGKIEYLQKLNDLKSKAIWITTAKEAEEHLDYLAVDGFSNLLTSSPPCMISYRSLSS